MPIQQQERRGLARHKGRPRRRRPGPGPGAAPPVLVLGPHPCGTPASPCARDCRDVLAHRRPQGHQRPHFSRQGGWSGALRLCDPGLLQSPRALSPSGTRTLGDARRSLGPPEQRPQSSSSQTHSPANTRVQTLSAGCVCAGPVGAGHAHRWDRAVGRRRHRAVSSRAQRPGVQAGAGDGLRDGPATLLGFRSPSGLWVESLDGRDGCGVILTLEHRPRGPTAWPRAARQLPRLRLWRGRVRAARCGLSPVPLPSLRDSSCQGRQASTPSAPLCQEARWGLVPTVFTYQPAAGLMPGDLPGPAGHTRG